VSGAVVIAPGGGEIIGDAPERRVAIVADDDALHATHTRFGPHRDGADLHVHERHTDVFYVLDGELTVRLGPEGEETTLAAGSLARIPPGVVHGFRNASDADVAYLNLHAPGARFADYLRGLRDGTPPPADYDQQPVPDDGGRPADEAEIGRAEELSDGAGNRVTLLADGAEVTVALLEAEPGDATPPHVHERHPECFYVLDGELELEAGGECFTLTAGAWALVPAGVPHTIANREPVRFLCVHAPGCGFAGFLRAAVAGAEPADAIATTGFDEVPAA
jgi:quercetin dioxygenase-like cupin family protein